MVKNAIAYLKGMPAEDDSPVTRLSDEDSPVIRPFVADLQVCYLVDTGNSYQYVQNRHIREFGISLDELHETGLQNLTRLTSIRDCRVKRHGHIYAFLMGGDFEASAILVDYLWDEKFRELVSGNYLAVVPSRDVLAFCDTCSVDSVMELRDVIGRVWPSGDHLISNKLYVRDNQGWRVSS
jgi:uncharacterized protein YtpQ (UPF0354 family)